MRHDKSPELGHDALDTGVARSAAAAWLAGVLPRRGAALGLTATAAPPLAFVLLGIALGPQALGLLSPTAIAHLDPVVSVALAALGVFIGLGLGAARRADASMLLGAAALETAVTTVVVGGAMYVLLARWDLPLSVSPVIFAGVLGICACASAATRVPSHAGVEFERAARIADLDDVPIVVLGTLAAAMASGAPGGAMRIGLTVAAAISAGAAGWLLFERAEDAAERGVFVTGAVVLLGGVSAYLGTSPLLSGCVAALVWVRAPGAADRIIAADLRKLQHPLVALLLIVAGASIEWGMALPWIAAPLVLFRLTGKLLASSAASRLVQVPSALLATVLMPPGVIGIALALNVQQVLGGSDASLLSAVTVAAVGSEVLAAALLDRPEASR